MSYHKSLDLERLVFFTDAVVAIAITLLALELKIEHTANGRLHFFDLIEKSHHFLAFFLSFFNIAIFWKVHHEFFHYIRRVNNEIFWYNVGWLLFIVLLPFTTSLIGSYFKDVAAMFLYCIDMFLIAVFQSRIWGFVSRRPTFLKKELSAEVNYENRLDCRVAMSNGLLATLISLISPATAFIILFFRYPMILAARKIFTFRQDGIVANSSGEGQPT